MNIMVEYLKINKSFITKYIKLVLDKKYNKKIADEFYKTYIETRYYFVDEQPGKLSLKNEILKSLDKTKKKLISENKENKTIIEQTRLFYNYILYFDNVINSKNIEKMILQIMEKKQEITGKEDFKLQKSIDNTYKEYQKEIEIFMQKFQTTKFELEFTKCNSQRDIRYVKLKQNIKIPLLYSDYAIEKAMETEPISEDKCFVEYHLLASHILSDILNGNNKKEYIADFPITILNKKQKTKRLLEIINNTLMQYKIILKINYKDFDKNKAMIYELIQQGYKFCIMIEKTDEISSNNMKRLEIFTYVIGKDREKLKNTEYKLNLIEE